MFRWIQTLLLSAVFSGLAAILEKEDEIMKSIKELAQDLAAKALIENDRFDALLAAFADVKDKLSKIQPAVDDPVVAGQIQDVINGMDAETAKVNAALEPPVVTDPPAADSPAADLEPSAPVADAPPAPDA